MSSDTQLKISRQVYTQDSFDKEFCLTSQPKKEKPKLFTFPKCSSKVFLSTLCTWIPIFRWLPKYRLPSFYADVIAGFTVAILSIPQALAYATLANVPEVIGLYSAFFPSLLYAIFGTSKHVSLGLFTVVSLIMSDAQEKILHNATSYELIEGLDIEDLPTVQISATVTFTVGLVMILMAVFQLHILVSYISDSLLDGFSTAASIQIMMLQVPHMLQVKIVKKAGLFKLVYMLIDIFYKISQANLMAVSLSAICCIILYIIKYHLDPKIKKFSPLPLPWEFVIIIIATLASYFCHFKSEFGLKLVDNIPTGIPKPIMPTFSQIPTILPEAIVIAIVIYSVTFSIAKFFSRKNKYTIDPQQELRALSICQIIPCFFLCQPSSVNFSRAAIADQAGVKSQIANVVSALVMLTVMLWAGPLIEPLPYCILCSIIFVVLLNVPMKEFPKVKELYKMSKNEFIIWVFSFLVTLLWDVSEGLIAAVIFSLLMIILKIQWSNVTHISQVGETEFYKNVENYNTLKSLDNILVFKFNAPLLYLNTERFHKHVMDLYTNSKNSCNSPVQYIIFDASETIYCDKAGATMLGTLAEDLAQENVNLMVATASDSFYKTCEKFDVFKKIPRERFFMTVHDAMMSCSNKSFIEIKHI